MSNPWCNCYFLLNAEITGLHALKTLLFNGGGFWVSIKKVVLNEHNPFYHFI